MRARNKHDRNRFQTHTPQYRNRSFNNNNNNNNIKICAIQINCKFHEKYITEFIFLFFAKLCFTTLQIYYLISLSVSISHNQSSSGVREGCGPPNDQRCVTPSASLIVCLQTSSPSNTAFH